MLATVKHQNEKERSSQTLCGCVCLEVGVVKEGGEIQTERLWMLRCSALRGTQRNNCLTDKIYMCICSSCLPSTWTDVGRHWAPTSWKPCHEVMLLYFIFFQPAEWRLARKGGWKLGAHSESLAVTHSFCINATGCGAASLINWIFFALCSVNAHLSSHTSPFTLSFIIIFLGDCGMMGYAPLGRQTPQPTEPSLRSRGVGLNKKNVTHFCWS